MKNKYILTASEVKGGSREELPHAPTPEARGDGWEEQPTPEARGGDEWSYPMSEVRGSGREYQTVTAQEQPRGDTTASEVGGRPRGDT